MPKPEPIDPAKLRFLESRARALAKQIEAGLHAATSNRYGFALMLFSFNGSELTYISNAARADMTQMLEELLDRWKRGDFNEFPGGIDARN